MAIYHCSIKIISRGSGRSVIAAAAYRSGDKLYDEETGLTHDYTHKSGVVYDEIVLPDNAPAEYSDRMTLWTDVQKVERRSDARLAREIEVALPKELTRKDQIECVRAYIKDNFTGAGMIADWALHDKRDGNPHAHILLTVRGFNEKREWDVKKKSVLANSRDEQGRPIYDPDKPSYDPKRKEETAQYRIPQLDANGKQKYRDRPGKGREMLWERVDVPANNWNARANAEKWRASWAEHCNVYLEPEIRIDHRSYERREIDREPTIHEGFAARRMEKEGKISERMEINREIRERNTIRDKIKQLARELTSAMTRKARELYERFRRLRGSIGPARKAGGAGGPDGGPAGRDGSSGEREFELERTTGRIAELERTVSESKHTVAETGRELEATDRELEATDRELEAASQRVRELRELKKRKERELDERLRNLQARRAAGHDGGAAGREPSAERRELAAAADDIRKFIADIDAKEQSARAVARNSELERQKRELEQQRLAAERSRKAKKRSRDHDHER